MTAGTWQIFATQNWGREVTALKLKQLEKCFFFFPVFLSENGAENAGRISGAVRFQGWQELLHVEGLLYKLGRGKNDIG